MPALAAGTLNSLAPHLTATLPSSSSPPSAVNALFNGYTVCVHPAFRNGEMSATSDPFGGYTGGDEELVAYLKANPELSRRAGVAAVGLAQHNPELALKVATASVGGGTGAKPAANPWVGSVNGTA